MLSMLHLREQENDRVAGRRVGMPPPVIRDDHGLSLELLGLGLLLPAHDHGGLHACVSTCAWRSFHVMHAASIFVMPPTDRGMSAPSRISSGLRSTAAQPLTPNTASITSTLAFLSFGAVALGKCCTSVAWIS